MTGDIADDSGNAGRADTVHVEEVARHQARAGLVHAADFEAGEIRHLLRGQARRPRLRRELLLLKGLAGTPLNIPAVAGHTGLGHRQAGPPQRHDGGCCEHRKPDDHIGVIDGSRRTQHGGEEAIHDRRVGFLAIGRERQRVGLHIAVEVVVDEPHHPETETSGSNVDKRREQRQKRC